LTAVASLLFFRASHPASGQELWASDGTPGGTYLVKDINPGTANTFAEHFTAMGARLFFGAVTGASGRELWTSDGTAAGTFLVKDILPGGGSGWPQSLAVFDCTLYFSADDVGSGQRHLWRSDGTPAGTWQVPDGWPGTSFNPKALVATASRLWFGAATPSAGEEPHTLAPEPATIYCTAKVNSCGGVPAIAQCGKSNATATAGHCISATGARQGKIGLLIYSDQGPRVPAVPFQGGLLCFESPVKRSSLQLSSGGSPGACDATFTIEMNAFAAGLLGGVPQSYLTTPGAQIECQWWGRDTTQNGSFLSDALGYVVGP
jgi:ELWxxDGT repeat protein